MKQCPALFHGQEAGAGASGLISRVSVKTGRPPRGDLFVVREALAARNVRIGASAARTSTSAMGGKWTFPSPKSLVISQLTNPKAGRRLVSRSFGPNAGIHSVIPLPGAAHDPANFNRASHFRQAAYREHVHPVAPNAGRELLVRNTCKRHVVHSSHKDDEGRPSVSVNLVHLGLRVPLAIRYRQIALHQVGALLLGAASGGRAG